MMMNNEFRSPIEDQLIDRLVDGELDASARRSLLSDFDETPGAWRQCAVAFLEAQAWRSDLRGALARSTDNDKPELLSAFGERPLRRRWRQTMGVAAAMLLAFATGWFARPERQSDHPATDGPVAEVRHDNSKAAPEARPETATNDSETEDSAAVRLAGVFKFEVDDRGQTRTIEVPVLEGPGVDPRWFLIQPPAIRASAVQALERRGHRVEAHRELLTVNLKDGRKLIVPVDEVGVRPAHRVFQ
jgi:hypothetical protein